MGDIDPAQSGYWSVRESFVSFVLTNLPAIYPLIKNFVDKTRLSYGSRSASNITGGAGKSGTNGYRLDSYPKGSRAQKQNATHSVTKVKIQHPWDSEEKIMGSDTKSPSSVMTGSLEDRSSSHEEIGDYIGECPGTHNRTEVIATRAKRGSQAVPAVGQSSEGNGILVTKAYEFRVSEAVENQQHHTRNHF